MSYLSDCGPRHVILDDEVETEVSSEELRGVVVVSVVAAAVTVMALRFSLLTLAGTRGNGFLLIGSIFGLFCGE